MSTAERRGPKHSKLASWQQLQQEKQEQTITEKFEEFKTTVDELIQESPELVNIEVTPDELPEVSNEPIPVKKNKKKEL